jgi:hypothetical protein
MNKFLIGVLSTAILAVIIFFFVTKNEEKQELEYNTALIQQQIQQVGKLVVTEGHFSQVTSYKNTKRNYLNIFSSNKKALVVVNAKVTVSYDLRQIATSINESSRTLTITSIPEAELNIYPDIEYYDVTQEYFNQFSAEDYNKIKDTVTKMIEEKVEASGIKENAKDHLISELQKIYILTNSMGWTLKYNDQTIQSIDGLERFNF